MQHLKPFAYVLVCSLPDSVLVSRHDLSTSPSLSLSLSSSLVYDLVSEVFGVSKGNVSVNVNVNVNVNANANTNTNVNANGSPHQVPASTLMARHN